MAGMVTALITGPNSCGVATRIARAWMMKGRKAVDVSHDALGVLDEIEGLLSDQVLNYARRGAE
ncbi:hypothetical protein P5W92_28595 [Streptomyces sp. J15]|uniref:Uncharacterized protein n=1 Tax=Streptomyces pakalii TaxID=3036494 RepID=A0ABT7DHE8_9ACTN|nr:hypothetical protein [Streptomyces pakalii]